MITRPSTPTGQILKNSLSMRTRLERFSLERLITNLNFGRGLALGKAFLSFLRIIHCISKNVKRGGQALKFFHFRCSCTTLLAKLHTVLAVRWARRP